MMARQQNKESPSARERAIDAYDSARERARDGERASWLAGAREAIELRARDVEQREARRGRLDQRFGLSAIRLREGPGPRPVARSVRLHELGLGGQQVGAVDRE